MQALAVLLATLLLGSTVEPDKRPMLELVIEGEALGSFAAMDWGEAETGVTVTLRDGRLEPRFFELWGEDLPASRLVRPGRHQLDPDQCPRRGVTLRQELGAGLRSRARSWALVEACPSSWVIAAPDEGSDPASESAAAHPITELTLVARELAAAL